MNTRKPDGYWTYDKCAIEALKYSTKEVALKCSGRFDFKKKYKGAYEASLRNNWLNEFYV
jgi:hypothetical protein